MKRQVIIHNDIEGFHRYPNAPSFCKYLSHRHRHIFNIRSYFNVSHNEREIEINIARLDIEEDLKKCFGYPCEFGDMSCESICEYLLDKYPALDRLEVTEDGYGGASLTR